MICTVYFHFFTPQGSQVNLPSFVSSWWLSTPLKRIWVNLGNLPKKSRTSRCFTCVNHHQFVVRIYWIYHETIMKPKIAIQWVEAHVGFTTCFQGFYGLSLTNLPRTWVLHGRIESPWNEPSRQHPARRFQPGATPSIIFGYTEENDKLIDALPTPHTVDGSEIPTNHLGWLKLKTLQYHGRSSSSLVVSRILEPSTVPPYIKCFKVQSNYSVTCIQYVSCPE